VIGAAPRRWSRRIGVALLGVTALTAAAGPVLAPNLATDQFENHSYAPRTPLHVLGGGGLLTPYINPLVLEDRLARRYREDRSVQVPLQWFRNGRLLSSSDPAHPLLLLGADSLGRDVFSRLVIGARLSLGVAALGLFGALVIGTIIGGLAGAVGGWTDRVLMLLADFLLALPAAYLVLVLRGVLPSVLATGQVFGLMAALFALAAWPHAARGVRAIVASERARDYAEAARAAGAGPWRLALHLVPAARGFLANEVILLLPALLIAEATISFLGLGFADKSPSWGTMMHDAASGTVLTEAPWMLAPSAAVFITVLGLQLIGLNRWGAGRPVAGVAGPS